VQVSTRRQLAFCRVPLLLGVGAPPVPPACPDLLGAPPAPSFSGSVSGIPIRSSDIAAHPHATVIPNAAGRRFFFPARSCEAVGLRM